jgi:hypothetical protein
LSAFIRSTIEVRHASFSPVAAAALSTIAATSTVCAGAADAVEAADGPAEDDAVLAPLAEALPPAAAPPLAGVALAWLPKIAPMIFPKMLIVCSQ